MRALRRGEYQSYFGMWDANGQRANFYDTPKEIWGFLKATGASDPEIVARRFLRGNAGLFKLNRGLAGLGRPRLLESLGAHHVIFPQTHLRRPIHRAYVTVHMDRRRRVYMAKNRFVPTECLPERGGFRLSREAAVRQAKGALPPRPGRRVTPLKTLFTRRMWYPAGGQILPAWRVRMERRRPLEEWVVYVDARTGEILDTPLDCLSKGTGSALVFDPSPVTALNGSDGLVTLTGRRAPPEAYRVVTLQGLCRSGWLDGARVTTDPTKGRRIRRRDGQFRLESRERGFGEVMAYYHVDSAVRYLQKLGYTGRRAIFRRPVRVRVDAWEENNSAYSSESRMLIMGNDQVPDAQDGETILHELGHAIQDAICRDFGQTPEAKAMGEGFGDYLAASFFEDRKPQRYRACVMTWDGLRNGGDPPCERRVDGSVTYDDFKGKGDEHENGKIWSATLWDIRETLGRSAADAIIIEGQFQLDAFTTFVRGARAILDADRNLHGGRHRRQLRRIFRHRRIWPLRDVVTGRR